ncbi:DUF1292 domain-containing protein [Faecalicatena contorta]|uniref:DUF1292 domain-containing protein n=1 Tax=Faecalicatena contorta TaxID=39482 RepID=UPI001F34EDB8|nr:DUF1292 domain-containing protein [Faecalicatena contorta]MCF2681696.1 DUF1292 domain-containing protein [Faecalicatena contorta]
MNETIDNDGYVTIELTLDNDEVIQCAILTVFEAGGEEYIALVPLDDNMEFDADSDIYLYRYSEDENGEPELGNIEDDDEYEAAADAFDEWMDTLELEDSDEE